MLGLTTPEPFIPQLVAQRAWSPNFPVNVVGYERFPTKRQKSNVPSWVQVPGARSFKGTDRPKILHGAAAGRLKKFYGCGLLLPRAPKPARTSTLPHRSTCISLSTLPQRRGHAVAALNAGPAIPTCTQLG